MDIILLDAYDRFRLLGYPLNVIRASRIPDLLILLYGERNARGTIKMLYVLERFNWDAVPVDQGRCFCGRRLSHAFSWPSSEWI